MKPKILHEKYIGAADIGIFLRGDTFETTIT